MAMTLSNFFFDTPIYTNIAIPDTDENLLRMIFDSTLSVSFDGYNPIAKVESTFNVITDNLGTGSTLWKAGGFRTVRIQCKRTEAVFEYYLMWNVERRELTKVGQWPSVADFHKHEIKQYGKLLTDEKLKELAKAIGLAANGVGIGSFVYLRRIFEFLIIRAHSKAIAAGAQIDGFEKARMDEKIGLLGKYLPNFLVEHKSMYGILSLGVHELSEEICLEHFDTLRVGIEIILDEQLQELEKAKKIQHASQKLQQLKSKIQRVVGE